MRDPDSYKPANLWVGVLMFLSSKNRFLDMASAHLAWANLKAPDLRAAYLNGTFDPCSDEMLKLEADRFAELRAQFWNSFLQMLGASALALAFGASVGVVGFSLPLHLGHLFGFSGAFLIAWAALFELGGPRLASWDGETACELLHPKIFQCIFLPGISVTLCSVLL